MRKQSKKPPVSVRVCCHFKAIAMTSILFLFQKQLSLLLISVIIFFIFDERFFLYHKVPCVTEKSTTVNVSFKPVSVQILISLWDYCDDVYIICVIGLITIIGYFLVQFSIWMNAFFSVPCSFIILLYLSDSTRAVIG